MEIQRQNYQDHLYLQIYCQFHVIYNKDVQLKFLRNFDREEKSSSDDRCLKENGQQYQR